MNHEADTLTPDVPNPEAMGDLEAQVQSQLRGRVRDFRLSLREGGLVLGGYSRTYYEKQLALHAVMEAIDLPIRGNEIEVA